MKKLYMIFALALCAAFATQPLLQADAGDVIGTGLLGAAIGGAAGGGRGAAIGAGAGLATGAALSSGRDREYYDDAYYGDDYGYGDDYYPRERYYRGGYYGNSYPGAGISVGLPFFMDVNNEIYSRYSMDDYPRNRNYMPGLNAPDYKEYWQKEGFYPPQEYEVELGAPRGERASSCDVNMNLDVMQETEFSTPESREMMYEAELEEPMTTTSESLTTRAARSTGDVVDSLGQTTADVVRPVADATADVVEATGEATADVVRPVARATGNVLRTIGETIEDVATPVYEERAEAVVEPMEPGNFIATRPVTTRPTTYTRSSTVPVVEPVADTTARTVETVGQTTADVVAPAAVVAEDVATAPLRLFQ